MQYPDNNRNGEENGQVLDQEEDLKQKIKMLEEARAALENQQYGASTFIPDDLWLISQIDDKNAPIPPQFHQILTGRVTEDKVDEIITRYERDLQDLTKSDEELMEEQYISDRNQENDNELMEGGKECSKIEEDSNEEIIDNMEKIKNRTILSQSLCNIKYKT